jgi:hypothetical protein
LFILGKGGDLTAVEFVEAAVKNTPASFVVALPFLRSVVQLPARYLNLISSNTYTTISQFNARSCSDCCVMEVLLNTSIDHTLRTSHEFFHSSF